MNNKKFCLAVWTQKLAAKTSWALVPCLTPSAFLFEQVTQFLWVMISPSVQICAQTDWFISHLIWMLGHLDAFRKEIAEREKCLCCRTWLKCYYCLNFVQFVFCTILSSVFYLSKFYREQPKSSHFSCWAEQASTFLNVSKHFKYILSCLTLLIKGT